MKKLSLRFMLVLLSFTALASTTNVKADGRPGQGFERNFNDDHRAGTKCEKLLTGHPDINGKYFVVTERFVADASYFGNRLFHNGDKMSSGTKLHECDMTVVAYNSLPRGTILRITRTEKDKDSPPNVEVEPTSIVVVVQDKGAEKVTVRPDLSRGAFEALKADGLPAEGIMEDLVYEILKPVKEIDVSEP